MVKRLDASSFCIHPSLSVGAFFALVLKVFRNRLRCHGPSVAELAHTSSMLKPVVRRQAARRCSAVSVRKLWRWAWSFARTRRRPLSAHASGLPPDSVLREGMQLWKPLSPIPQMNDGVVHFGKDSATPCAYLNRPTNKRL